MDYASAYTSLGNHVRKSSYIAVQNTSYKCYEIIRPSHIEAITRCSWSVRPFIPYESRLNYTDNNRLRQDPPESSPPPPSPSPSPNANPNPNSNPNLNPNPPWSLT